MSSVRPTTIYLGFLVFVMLGVCKLEAQSQIDQLKQFVSSPPVISEIIFRYHDVNIGPTNSEAEEWFFAAKWQPNAFCLKQSRDLSALRAASIVDADRAMGFYGSNYWVADAFEVNRSIRGSEASESIVRVVQAEYEIQISTVFNLGIPNVRIGSVQWDGDSFLANTYNDHAIRGRLLASTSGKPDKLEMTRKLPDRSVEIEVELLYQTRLSLSYLPSMIRRYIKTPGGRQLSAEIEILSIETKAQPLGEKLFTPGQYVPSHLKYETLVNGTNVSRRMIGDDGKSQNDHAQLYSAVVFTLLSLTTCLGGWLLLKYGRSKK